MSDRIERLNRFGRELSWRAAAIAPAVVVVAQAIGALAMGQGHPVEAPVARDMDLASLFRELHERSGR